MKITILGDVMCDMTQLKAYYKEKYNFDYAFDKVKYQLNKSDYVICNMETPIAGESAKYVFEKYSFNAPIEFAQSVRKAGVDMVITANNHCLDRGVIGLKNTISNLKKCGFEYIGTHIKPEKSYLIKEIDGIKVGIIAFTYGTNAFSNNEYIKKSQRYTVDLLQKQELSNIFLRKVWMSSSLIFKCFRKVGEVLNLFQLNKPVYERKEYDSYEKVHFEKSVRDCRKAGAEFIICLLHIGGQYNEMPTKYTREMCNLSLELGVDAVIANHEHVIHPIDRECLRNGKFIIYSLGNFLGTAGVNQEPFDKQAEYSVGIHLVINDKRKVEYYFSIYKCIEKQDGKVRVELLYNLINECEDIDKKLKLTEINNELVNRVLNTAGTSYPIKEEYRIIN